MNLFAKNLQFYRKRDNMTQEQLAERLEVTRQTISKWEAGTSFAEMEKILQLCDIFSCNMDTLMRKDAEETEAGDNQRHRNHMEKRRRGICFGVVLLVADVALYELLTGFGVGEAVLNTLFMAIAIVAVLVLVVQGLEHDNYKKKFPFIQEFYTQEEKEEFDRKFPSRIAAGIGLILIGALVGMNGEYFPLKEGMSEEVYYGIFLFFVAVAVGILVYTGLGKEKYDISAYNKNNTYDSQGKKISVWCGCIMLAATAVFLVTGLVFSLWSIGWVVYPIGGLLCGMVTLILNRQE